MLIFQNFKKAYNRETVIGIENLFLDSGVYWIKGENGTGKSTLLKSIAGLIPFEGQISLAGVMNNDKNINTYRRMVNYGEAEPLFPGFLKANDLLMLFKHAKSATTEQVDYLITKLGIKKYRYKRIGEYSSGMIKKLSLALAFIGEPTLVLLDEPLITLDADAVNTVLELIEEYHAKGVSFIFTSHQELREDTTFKVEMFLLENHQLKELP